MDSSDDAMKLIANKVALHAEEHAVTGAVADPAWERDPKFADRVAAAATEAFSACPSRGKPQEGEWTVLAAFVLCIDWSVAGSREENGDAWSVREVADGLETGYSLIVAAIGTGTKCVGQSRVDDDGLVVPDAHAEMVARRAFEGFLMHDLTRHLSRDSNSTAVAASQCGAGPADPGPGDSLFFETVELTTADAGSELVIRRRPGVSVHFYTSHTPCGDASIVSKDCEGDRDADPVDAARMEGGAGRCVVVGSLQVSSQQTRGSAADGVIADGGSGRLGKRSFSRSAHFDVEPALLSGESNEDALERDGGGAEPGAKRTRVSRDVYRTGAPPVAEGEQDQRGPGVGYHVTGVLRHKPGRGEPSLAMSCSDEIMRWTVVGVQGSLLTPMTGPVYVASVSVGELYNRDALSRALLERATNAADALANVAGTGAFEVHHPIILECSFEVPFARRLVEEYCGNRAKTAASSMYWVRGGPVGVIESKIGLRLGATRKSRRQLRVAPAISDRRLFVDFVALVDQLRDVLGAGIGSPRINGRVLDLDSAWSYPECLAEAAPGWSAAAAAFCSAFPGWIPPKAERSATFTVAQARDDRLTLERRR